MVDIMDVVIPCPLRRAQRSVQAIGRLGVQRSLGIGGWRGVGQRLNANQVRRWMRDCGVEPPSRRCLARGTVSEGAMGGFVPVSVRCGATGDSA